MFNIIIMKPHQDLTLMQEKLPNLLLTIIDMKPMLNKKHKI